MIKKNILIVVCPVIYFTHWVPNLIWICMFYVQQEENLVYIFIFKEKHPEES